MSGSHCSGCGLTFGSQRAFDRHRIGRGQERRCRSPEEMGYERNAWGRWTDGREAARARARFVAGVAPDANGGPIVGDDSCGTIVCGGGALTPEQLTRLAAAVVGVLEAGGALSGIEARAMRRAGA